jgi:hypothetical protein
MATITDFAAWLDEAAPETADEIYDLYTSVRDEESGSFFALTKGQDGKLFLKGDSTEDTLMIVPHAKEVFLKEVWGRYITDKDLGIEGWYALQRAMAKDD